MKAPLRPAKLSEISLVQSMLASAVNELLEPDSDFARAEKARFSSAFLGALMEADPGYVVIVETAAKEMAGFIVGVPEMGHMILSWGYVKPEFRKGTLAMRGFGEFVRLWDNRNFHKLVYYALPQNKQSEAIGRHAKFEKVALLRKHFFGEDFVLYEKFYNKVEVGLPAMPVYRGRRGRLAAKLRRLMDGKPA